MKLINRKNFFPIVCVNFTLIILGKLIIEKITGFFDPNYTENIFIVFGFSVLITGVLALHFYLQRFPFIPVFIAQYAAVAAAVVILVKAVDAVSGTAPGALWQMLLSVTIPFVCGAAVYYIYFFRQVKKANEILKTLGSDS